MNEWATKEALQFSNVPIRDSTLMQLSMQNYQAVFFTKINIGAFNILLQLNLDQIKVGFTPINKIHADVKI